MPLPLPVFGSASPARQWGRFLQRRDALVARMEMETCDGCDGCGQRCTDGFLVTRAEWEAARDYLTAQPLEVRARLSRQPREIPWPGAEDSGATVAVCPFRDQENALCAIYPVRPTVCRLFGHTSWLPCPIEAVSSVPDGSAALWNMYRDFERRTWAEWAREETGEGMPNDGVVGLP